MTPTQLLDSCLGEVREKLNKVLTAKKPRRADVLAARKLAKEVCLYVNGAK